MTAALYLALSLLALLAIAVASEHYGAHKVIGGILVALILAGVIWGCSMTGVR
jgi:hypothetical protein